MGEAQSYPTLPQIQRAWTYTSRGLPREILTLNTSYPVPPPPAGNNLLIRVTHVGLNPGCYMTLSTIPTYIRYIFSKGKTTYVPEGEFSGIIQLAGPGVSRTHTELSPGTRVFGSLPVLALLGGDGPLAEYFCVSAEDVAVVPPVMRMSEAAGLSGSGQTAWNMLTESGADIRQGTRVFVNGGSGGVGTMVIQLAKTMGAYVVTTCSERSKKLVESLGADEVVDYRTYRPLHAHLSKTYHDQPFDYILDTIGTGDLFIYSPTYLTSTGAYINVGNFEGVGITIVRCILNTYLRYYLPPVLGGVPRRYTMISTTSNGKKAARLARLVEEGKLKVVVDEVVEFEDVLQAYDRMLAKMALGKIIVKVRDE